MLLVDDLLKYTYGSSGIGGIGGILPPPFTVCAGLSYGYMYIYIYTYIHTHIYTPSLSTFFFVCLMCASKMCHRYRRL